MVAADISNRQAISPAFRFPSFNRFKISLRVGSARALNVFWNMTSLPSSFDSQYSTAFVFVNNILMNFEMFGRKRQRLLQWDMVYMQMAAATATLSDSNCAISM